MNYHQYYPIDVVNGPGTRCTLFVAGCEHQCQGCYNKSTWRVNSGIVFDASAEQQIITDLQDQRIPRQGLSLSGGDPLHPANLNDIFQLLERVNHECPTKDIWLWTGYRLAELNKQQQAIIKLIDVLIDGRFEQALADPSLIWRGSSNQKIHYLR